LQFAHALPPMWQGEHECWKTGKMSFSKTGGAASAALAAICAAGAAKSETQSKTRPSNAADRIVLTGTWRYWLSVSKI